MMGVIVDGVGVAVRSRVVEGRAAVVLFLAIVLLAVVRVDMVVSGRDDGDGESVDADAEELGDGATDAWWLEVIGSSRFL